MTARSHSFALPTELVGRRVALRPLTEADYEAWADVRHRCKDWLLKWEPLPMPGRRDVTETRHTFGARCAAREREWQLGSGYGFGIFVNEPRRPMREDRTASNAARGSASEGLRGSRRLGGEINLSSVQRGPYQNAYVGYWIDEALAGQSYMPEALVVVARFAFEDLGLHRIQVSVIPRNVASRRVAEKVGLRNEGVAERYLQIAGVWEDHVRYAMTSEEWDERADELIAAWIR